jgi:hypothetical protein
MLYVAIIKLNGAKIKMNWASKTNQSKPQMQGVAEQEAQPALGR